MRIAIDEAKNLALKSLLIFGFSQPDSNLATDLIVDAEISGKASHGLVRIINMAKMISDGRVTVTKQASTVTKETSSSLLIDGRKKPGFMVVPFTLNLAIKKLKKGKLDIVCAGATNTSPAAGMIGHFARLATEQNMIYIGFHNSMSYLVPHGSKKALWGSNPVTIGVPSDDGPVIWDSGSSKISVGEIVLAKREGKSIPEGIALDTLGNPTIDPAEALIGGILPFSAHKGSGMAMMVEILAGSLINSAITPETQWNWGSFFILINPATFRAIEEFKTSVSSSIKLLKELPKADNIEEIYYPGERSQKTRKENLKSGYIEVLDNTYNELVALAKA